MRELSISANGTPESSSLLRERKTQNLDFDTTILCSDCDGKLGDYDNELIKFYREFVDSDVREKAPQENSVFFQYRTNTNRLYLGFAASLYRHSISTHYPLIKLGKYNENFKNALRDNNIDPIKNIFNIHAWGTYETNPKSPRFIFQIDPAKYKSLSAYSFQISGVLSIMTVGQKQFKDIFPIDPPPHIAQEVLQNYTEQVLHHRIKPDDVSVQLPLIDPYSSPWFKTLLNAVPQTK